MWETRKIAIPKTDKTILGNIPRFKTLEVVGIFDLGLYEYDPNFLSSELVRKLLLYDEDIYNKIDSLYHLLLKLNYLKIK